MTKSALLLIDIQNDYFPSFSGSRMALPNMETASANAAALLKTAREMGMRVIHIQHRMPSDAAPFFRPGTPGADINESVAPLAGETVIEKTRPSSFVGTGLDTVLTEAGIGHLVVCGAMSQMCVDATVRAAVDLGFKVTLAHDACAAATVTHDGTTVPADLVHAAIMAPLAASYATVQRSAEIIRDLMG